MIFKNKNALNKIRKKSEKVYHGHKPFINLKVNQKNCMIFFFLIMKRLEFKTFLVWSITYKSSFFSSAWCALLDSFSHVREFTQMANFGQEAWGEKKDFFLCQIRNLF